MSTSCRYVGFRHFEKNLSAEREWVALSVLAADVSLSCDYAQDW